MKKINLLVPLSLLTLLSTTTFAATHTTKPNPSREATSGIYVEANTGYSLLQTADKDSAGLSTDQERGNAAVGLNIGYDQALSNTFSIGGEFGADYNGYSSVKLQSGTSSTECAKIKSYDLHFLLTGKYQLMNSGWSIIGKGGVALVKQEMDSSGPLGNIGDKTEIRPMAEAGIGYMLNNNVNLHIMYTRIFGKDQKNLPAPGSKFADVAAANMVKVGLSYKLPV